MKQKYRIGELEKDKVDKLFSVGLILGKILDKKWEEQLKKVLIWYKENGRWPRTRTQNEAGKSLEGKLGNWLLAQKNWYWGNSVNKSDYPEDRKNKLESIGYSLDRKRGVNQTWEEQFEFLEEFRRLYPDRWPKSNEQYPDGNNLGLWTVTQRQMFRKGSLEKFRKDLLRSIEFNIEPSVRNRSFGTRTHGEDFWYKRFEDVKTIIDNKIKISSTKTEKEYHWLYKQKKLFKEGLLSENKIELLKNLGLL